MKNNKAPLLFTASLLFLPQGAEAVVLSQFNFDLNSSASTDTSLISTTSAWDMTNAGDLGGIVNDHTRTAASNAGSTYTALSPYQSFTVTASDPSLANLQLETLNFDYFHEGTTLNWELKVFSSLTGFDLATDELATAVAVNSAPTSVSIDLTAADPLFSNVANGSSVEFRIYFTDGSGSGTRFHTIDDVVLSGSAVPEPSSVGLFGLGILGMIIRRRRP